eukprot:TRINITY_DN16688_c0_g1_i1.p1 TRINITY_DN16688_c0_g1~~TRINITY_DN16688_c0_g1_i1.p1  ORF type:complete len:1341 (-),score=339.09 TRINITY_DN16688_c0_g1_i1:142-4164(-)
MAEDVTSIVLQALQRQPLFSGVEEEVLRDVAELAQPMELLESSELELADGQPMYVVVSGDIQLCVGCGPVAAHGPGSVVNVVGMLGLNQVAEPFKPIHVHESKDLATAEKNQEVNEDDALSDFEKARIMNNLCPHAVTALTPTTCGVKISGWLRLSAAAHQQPVRLAAIHPELLQEVLSRSVTSNSQFVANRAELVSMWLTIVKAHVFPGVPPEVIWAVAEQSFHDVTEEGENVVSEADVGDAAESIVVIEEGEAFVDKMIHLQGTEASQQVCGSLGPGAIIGNICFVGVKVPRAASVRAHTPVATVRIPNAVIIGILERFPGFNACMKGRLRDTAMLLQPSLPPRVNVISMLRIFSRCGEEFLKEVASIAERRLLHCGDVIIPEGGTEGNLCVVEFGQCRVDKIGVGKLDVAPIGTCFGERTFLGLAPEAGATVSAATPLALILIVPKLMFSTVLARYPKEQQRLTEGIASGNVRHSDVAQLKVLAQRSKDFVKAIEGGIEMRCFMPGQTVCVQGSADGGSMYVVKSGRSMVEVNGKMTRELQSGANFGELGMLGLVRRRTTTVKALTLCFMYEIPRAAFLQALEQHPEERDYFERMAAKHGGSSLCVTWPVFRDASDTLLYLVNHHAERRITPAGAWTSRKGEPLKRAAAILVMQGVIKLVGDNGEELEELTEGHCLNEQVLLGLPETAGTLVPKVSSEVQMISKEAFDKILDEFPSGQEGVMQNLVAEIVGKAEHKCLRRLEIEDGIPEVPGGPLHYSALFRGAPDFARHAQKFLKARLYMPGELITTAGEKGDQMYVLVQGSAFMEGVGEQKWLEFRTGSVFGEAVVFGVTRCYPTTVRASGLCCVKSLSCDGFQEALSDHPDTEIRSMLQRLQQAQNGRPLYERVPESSLLAQAGEDFVNVACAYADDAFFAAGEEVINRTEVCALGDTSVYVLLSGEADIENEFGIALGPLSENDICGEGGGLGMQMYRNMTVRSGKVAGPTYFARLHGKSLKAAADAFPDKYQLLVDTFEARRQANQAYSCSRSMWLDRAVVPALAASSIFQGFSKEVLALMAQPLVVTTYEPGAAIRAAGDTVDSLVVLVEGEADVHSKTGEVGRFTSGATFGEVAAMGLFELAFTTVRAVTQCHVLAVPTVLIQDVLSRPQAESENTLFEKLVDDRQRQVAAGLPLCSLSWSIPTSSEKINVSLEDMCARIVALHAALVSLAPGEMAQPLSDSSPNGPHFMILVKGRASLIVGDGPSVMTLLATGRNVLPEGLASKYGAHIHAVTACDFYRIRMCDFLLAEHSAAPGTKWLSHFRKQYVEEGEYIDTRLGNARGVINNKVPQMNAYMRGWG